MKRSVVLTLFTLIFAFNVKAQTKKEKDHEAIKKMCGCYEVSFDFAETFEYSNDSAYIPSKVKHSKGLEWVELVEDSDDKIVMQHLLIVGKPEKRSVIKHWRQDWLFENTNFYMFNADNNWRFVKMPNDKVKGQWTQKVFQVDDSPRYEGSATWVHVDGKSFWENTTDAPLPRREYTKRNDYNVTVRTNKHEITKEGWIHDQDNDKVIRKEGEKDILLAQEKGLNTYRKVDDSKCNLAQEWWSKNKEDWAIVRSKWRNVFAQSTNLKLKNKVDDKPLFRHLFSKEFAFNTETVSDIIDQFITE